MTLIELLVATSLSLIVIAGGYALMVSVTRGEADQRERVGSVQQARVMADRITREIRQGYGVETAQADQLELLTWVKSASCGGAPAASSVECRVVYSCSAGRCTRGESDPDATPSSSTELVRGLADDAVFEYAPSAADPTWVGIRLSFPAGEGEDAITLEDGAALRNASFGA